MSDLLDFVFLAHGGWDQWQRLSKITVTASIGGGLWAIKGKDRILDNVTVEVDCHRQHVICRPFIFPEWHSVYTPSRTAIETTDGEIVESRDNPRAAFKGHVRDTHWDNLHVIYFSGYAMWTYLTTPFVLNLPNVLTEEIEPWDEHGCIWRRLKVTFPPEIATHSAEQIFYFDKMGLLRRHDYSVDILGGSASANYAYEHKEFSGLVIPTKRRVYTRRPDGHPILERVSVTIDFHQIKVY
jgi:hypothetical protein